MKNGAYYCLYNCQGDVIGIVASDLTSVAPCEYDSWGKLLSVSGLQASTVGRLNPFRYRGYCYDEESGFYYLNSRYYDPEVGRFINADSEISGVGGEVLGYNLFAYCFNNPVNTSDQDGNWTKWIKKAVAAVAALKGAAIGAAGGALSGAITGAITGGIHNKVKGVCFVAGTSVLTSVGYVLIEDISVGDKVWSENPETVEKELKEVVQTFVNATNELVHVHVNGEEIITTPEHPFYVPKKGWVEAIDLRAGDILVLQSGEYVVELI